MKRNQSLFKIFFSLFAVLAPAFAFAQLLPPPPPPGAVPLDPAGWLMLASGGFLIGRKFYKEKFSK